MVAPDGPGTSRALSRRGLRAHTPGPSVRPGVQPGMTSHVIDSVRARCWNRVMTTGAVPVSVPVRYDRTLRVVMWLDAWLSTAAVLAGFLISPLLAVVGLSGTLLTVFVAVSIASAVLLAAFGAITAVVLMLRMQAGNYRLPPRLWLPLPPGMKPEGSRW